MWVSVVRRRALPVEKSPRGCSFAHPVLEGCCTWPGNGVVRAVRCQPTGHPGPSAALEICTLFCVPCHYLPSSHCRPLRKSQITTSSGNVFAYSCACRQWPPGFSAGSGPGASGQPHRYVTGMGKRVGFNILFTGNLTSWFPGRCSHMQKSSEGTCQLSAVPRGALPCQSVFASLCEPALLPVLAAKPTGLLGLSLELV